MDQQEYVRRLLADFSLAHYDTVSPEYEYPYWSSPNQEPTLQSHHNSLAPTSWGFLNSMPFFQSRPPPVSNGFGSLNLNSNRRFPLSDRRPRWSFSLESLKGRIAGLAKNQYGCKLLQKILGNGAPEEIEAVFLELIDHVGDLMVDQFGNYVVQKIVEVCSEEQRSQIVVALTETRFQLVTICLSMHGTRAVQLLLKYINSPKEISMIISALRPGFVVLTKDVNGHHVIIHCLKHFSFEDNKYLLNEAAKHCYDIARDKSGCCVLQLCVDNSQGETRDRLVAQIIANALCLAEDPYGNYVIQHLLGSKIPEIISDILKRLRREYAALSRNKYGSNVVEKCLSMSTEEQSSQIIIELLCSSTASMILVDQYGNFVIQSALMVAKGEVYEALVGLIQMNLPMMRNNMYGKKVLAWFDRRRLPLV